MTSIHFVGGNTGNLGQDQVWGGSMATGYCIRAAFRDCPTHKLVARPRGDFKNAGEVKDFLDQGDVAWLDETSLLAEFYQSGFDRPDIVGPVARSPIKRYYMPDRTHWACPYKPKWFYSGPVVRLNEAEERDKVLLDPYKGGNWMQHVSMIRHCIDLDHIVPAGWGDRRLVLWAGNRSRPAKNHALWEEIQARVVELGGLPEGWSFKTISGHTIDSYLSLLDQTALLVNTSLYESFCNAVNEARAKGVGTLVKPNFNGDFMFLDQPIQVPYTAEGYAQAIRNLTGGGRLAQVGAASRAWAEKNVAPKHMREDILTALYRV